jgi:hypothetical protein
MGIGDLTFLYNYQMIRKKQPGNGHVTIKWLRCNDMDSDDMAFWNDWKIITNEQPGIYYMTKTWL